MPLSSATAGALNRCVYSINDATVPYMTAYVDLEDPFLNHSSDGLTVYVAPRSTNMYTHLLSGSMMRSTSQSSNLIPYRTPRPPNPKLLVSSHGSGSNLTGHPFRLAFKVPFPSTWSVYMNLAEANCIIIIDPLTGFARSAPDTLPYLHLLCTGQAFDLITSFPLPHQAP